MKNFHFNGLETTKWKKNATVDILKEKINLNSNFEKGWLCAENPKDSIFNKNKYINLI